MIRLISINRIFTMKKDKKTLIISVSDIAPYFRIIVPVSVDASNSGRTIARAISENTRLSDAETMKREVSNA